MAEKKVIRVLAIRFKTDATGISAVIQFGNQELERAIPSGHAVQGINLVMDASGSVSMSDAELVTEKQ